MKASLALVVQKVELLVLSSKVPAVAVKVVVFYIEISGPMIVLKSFIKRQ